MEKPGDDYTKQNKSERERQIPYNITYVESKKNDTNELIYEMEIESKMQKTNTCSPRGDGGREK